jgi:hypothetical protein
MKRLYHLLYGVFLLIFPGNGLSWAQQGEITGRVVDAATGKAVEYTAVLNYSRHLRMYSNTAGEFKLPAQEGDTLVFYAVGYFYEKVIAHADMINSGTPRVFTLMQQTFEIQEVRVYSLGTYEDFRERFINLDRPATQTEKLAADLAETSRTVAREAYDQAKAAKMLNGITFVAVPILTPDEKERLMLAQIIKEEKINDQIYQKYNPVVVKKVTGLTDDDDIIEFMVFCNYSDTYLLKVNDYDLMVSIGRKYEQFKRKKQEEKSMQNQIEMIFDEQYALACFTSF